MNPIHRNAMPHRAVSPTTGGRQKAESTQSGTRSSAQSAIAALPASAQVGNQTFHIGRVITTLSDTEAELLHGALHPLTPKESLSDSPDENGLYSYAIGAKDYFASAHLPRQYPERMLVTCALDSSNGFKNVLISDLKSDNVYCNASFDRPVTATQVPISEQAASATGGHSPSRTNLSLFSNSGLTQAA